MASGTYVPSSAGTVNADKLLAEKWAGEADAAAAEVPVLYKRIRQTGPTGKLFHLPKIGTFSRTLIAETLSGYQTGLTFVGNAETEFTMTPRTSVIPLEITKSVGWRSLALDPKAELRQAAEAHFMASIDADVLALATAFATNIIGDPAVHPGKGDYLSAYQKVTGGAKQYAEPGTGKVLLVVHNVEVDTLLGIDSFVDAKFRGDSANPAVKGWVQTAFGMDISETTGVSTSGGYAANMACAPRALAIGFNTPQPMVITESYQIWDRIIILADYATGTVRDEYCVLIKGPTS